MSKSSWLIPLWLLGGTLTAAAEPQQLGLEQAVQRALERNPSLAVAQADIRRAEALLRQVRAGSLPSLTGTAGYTRLDDDRRVGASTLVAADQLSVSVDMNLPLLQPARWARWLEARDDVGVARMEAEVARRQVAAATAEAYLLVLAQHRQMAVARRAREVAAAHRDFARERMLRGVGGRLDELRAAEELAADQVTMEGAQAALAQAREALGVLVGADTAVDSLDEARLEVPPEAEAAGVWVRSDVSALADRAHAARRASRRSFADYLPQLSADFMPYYQHPGSITQPEMGWQAQLVLTLPLYDGGRRYGAAREREALLSRAEARLEGATRQARAEVRAAAEAVRCTTAAQRAAQERVQTANEALRLANLAYRAGATSNIEVIDAVRRARDAEAAASITQDAALKARLALLVATGLFPGTGAGPRTFGQPSSR